LVKSESLQEHLFINAVDDVVV